MVRVDFVYPLLYILYIICYILHNIYYILFIIYYILYIIYYILYIIYYIYSSYIISRRYTIYILYIYGVSVHLTERVNVKMYLLTRVECIGIYVVFQKLTKFLGRIATLYIERMSSS